MQKKVEDAQTTTVKLYIKPNRQSAVPLQARPDEP